jgi:tetratricopeptide (TPR) repeat protein
MSKPVVFISYSREDDNWRYRVAQLLERRGIEVWDDNRIQWGDRWRQRIVEAISGASAAVLLLSEHFLKSGFIHESELPPVRERMERDGMPVFPIVVSPCEFRSIEWLRELQIPKLPTEETYQAGAVLAAIIEDVGRILETRTATTARPLRQPAPRPFRVSPGGLKLMSRELFGRTGELATLDQAWEARETNVVCISAFGGVGKTALVERWLANLSGDGFRGAEAVYGWSFSVAGGAEGGQGSADSFLAAALAWFGDPAPEQGTPWNKGERLAELIRRRRTLLILDGVEPFMEPSDDSGGHMKDAGLQSLLNALVWANPGLCVVTSRLALGDLRDSAHVASIDLDNLRPADAARYLATLGVKGTELELEETAREYGGHALALTLVGKYLAAACHGDVRRRDKVPARPVSRVSQIMEAYEGWWKGRPELSILRILGLFDRQADAGALEALRAAQPIDGLTSDLQGLTEEEWQTAVNSLRAARVVDLPDPAHPDSLGCHALVRRHFGDKLKQTSPAAWKAGHERLYRHYASLPRKDLPETFEEMTPLFAAIWHGCEAGRHQEALDEIYYRRTRRSGEFYSTQKLGAFGADLAALACFFDPPWGRPVESLSEIDQGIVLNEAGEALRALGRLQEAAVPLLEASRVNAALGNWSIAAINLGNLSQLFLAIGDLPRALQHGRESVDLAERSGDPFQRMVRRADLANTLHHMGWFGQAQAAFAYAESVQSRVADSLEMPDAPPLPPSIRKEWGGRFLHAVRGFQYCDFLLTEGRFREVLERTSETLMFTKGTGRLLHIGLNHLSAGRAKLMEADALGSNDLAEAAYQLEQALSYLRQCGRRDYLPGGLMARAELHRRRRLLKDAHCDLDEALSIAQRDGMALHEADGHLEYARLYLALDDQDKARQSAEAAGRLIERCEYRRRYGELEALRRSI